MNRINEKNTYSVTRLAVFTFSHFIVDFCCFYMLFSWYSSGASPIQTVIIGFLAYNIIAFGLQPVIGYICDANKKIPAEIIGFILLIIGIFSMPFPAASIALMGTGNAFFHIAGGVESLRSSGGKLSRSGVFVSSGALGVVFGNLAGSAGRLPVYVLIGVSMLCLILMCGIYKKRLKSNETAAVFALAKPGLKFGTVIIFAAVSIMIRSYAGSVLPAEWKTTTLLIVFPAAGAFFGKFAGGFIADRVGARRTAVLSLLAAMAFLAFGYTQPWVYLVGVAFFNMSMSVTLCTVASVLPDNPGLAFGITTLALLCGNIPTFFMPVENAALVFIVLTVISTACLYHILKGKNHNIRRLHSE